MSDVGHVSLSNRTVAMYKGLKVAVYAVAKADISLTRQDLIELINVCTVLYFIIRPHRMQSARMRPTVVDVAWSVCLCVSVGHNRSAWVCTHPMDARKLSSGSPLKGMGNFFGEGAFPVSL